MRFASVMLALVVSMAALAPDPAQAQPSAAWNFELLGWVNYDVGRSEARISRVGDKIAVVAGQTQLAAYSGIDECELILIDASDPHRPIILSQLSFKNDNINRKDVVSTGNFVIVEENGAVEIFQYDGHNSLASVYRAESYVSAFALGDLIILSKEREGIQVFNVSTNHLTLVNESEEYGGVYQTRGRMLYASLYPYRMILHSDGRLEEVYSPPGMWSGYTIGSKSYGIMYSVGYGGLQGQVRHRPGAIGLVTNNLGYGDFDGELAVIDIAAFNTPHYLKATYPLNQHIDMLVEGDLVYYATGQGHMGILRYAGGPATRPILNAEVVGSQFPTSLKAGEATTATLELRNPGPGFWSEWISTKLAILNGGDLLFEPDRYRIEVPTTIVVPPGETFVFELPLRIPAFGGPTGPVTLRMQMVQEWEEFFGPVIEKVIYVSERNAAGNWLLLD